MSSLYSVFLSSRVNNNRMAPKTITSHWFLLINKAAAASHFPTMSTKKNTHATTVAWNYTTSCRNQNSFMMSNNNSRIMCLWTRNLSSSSSSSSSLLRMNKETTTTTTRLRTHAINILNGNYDDLGSNSNTNINKSHVGGIRNKDFVYKNKSNDPEEEDYDDDYDNYSSLFLDKTEKISNSKSVDLYNSFDYDIKKNKSKKDNNDDNDDDDLLAASVVEIQRLREVEIQRRLRTAQPKEHIQQLDEKGRAYGHGGRKTANARVWIYPGEGLLTINKRTFESYFPRDSDRNMILNPFVATQTCGTFDVYVTVDGGGITGKAGAIRHGIARALEKYNPEKYRPALKRLGYLTRDPRMVERKKIGHKKARKKPQWVRR